jgi:hypothetical protein
MWWLAIINCVFGLVTYFGLRLGLTHLGMRVIGMYQELDRSGAINRDVMRSKFGDRMADDWFLVPTEYLVGDTYDSVASFSYVVCAMFAVNAILLVLFAVRLRRSVGKADGMAGGAA